MSYATVEKSPGHSRTKRKRSGTTETGQSSDVRPLPGVGKTATRKLEQGQADQEQGAPDTKTETPEVPHQVP